MWVFLTQCTTGCTFKWVWTPFCCVKQKGTILKCSFKKNHPSPPCDLNHLLFSPYYMQVNVISRELQTKNKTENSPRCCKTSTTTGGVRKAFSSAHVLPLYTSSVFYQHLSEVKQSSAKHALQFHTHRDTQACLPRPHWCSQLWLLPLFGHRYVRLSV